MVQPNFPRFVRPGDRFTVAGLGRIIEGDAGPGRAELHADGLTLVGRGQAGLRLDRGQAGASRLPGDGADPDLYQGGQARAPIGHGRAGGRAQQRPGARRGLDRPADRARSPPGRSPPAGRSRPAGDAAGDHRAFPRRHAPPQDPAVEPAGAAAHGGGARLPAGLSLWLHRAADQPRPRRARRCAGSATR